jgi:class 3 adenylate cyclase/tetratricopeptide (TPR) repeat protein
MSDRIEPNLPGATASGEIASPALCSLTERLATYVPRILQQHLVDAPGKPAWESEGSAALVDITGFTELSERLARKGKEGAEQITEAIGTSFESILHVAYEDGGALLKFGGDAMLVWFGGDGHEARACRAGVAMRQVLRAVGRIEVPGARTSLRMSQAVQSGRFHFFAVGESHVELLPVGPAWSRLVALEKEAASGEILISANTAERLSSRCVGQPKGPGFVLSRAPNGFQKHRPPPRPPIALEVLAGCLSPAIREHVCAGGGAPEHRAVTIAFIRFEGTDALIEQQGAEVAARTLHDFLGAVDAAANLHRVTVLGSDIDADGGKLILTAGAPRILGDDEERMLLALRRVVEQSGPLAVRIGVHRGAVFAGDIGPAYRRTYTVMGDAVNLAARLMAKAAPGEIYASREVLEHSNALFETKELAPLQVKGKAQPVRAWSLGRAIGTRARQSSLRQLPLVGRDKDVAALRDAVQAARGGSGRLVAVGGELGVGKTRLLEALRDEAQGFVHMHAVCESYTASTPYAVWTEVLRERMQCGRDDPDAVIEERLRAEIDARAPELAAWTPLVAIAFGLQTPPTPEVALLAESNRRAKLHEAVGSFLAASLTEPTLVAFENAHNMDPASAELLAHLAGELSMRPWLLAVAYRPSAQGFGVPGVPGLVRLDLEPLGASDALRLAHADTESRTLPLHTLEAVARRSGGNPQFLRDLVRAALDSGGAVGLPDSAEAAAMARIDALAPEVRELVRRAAVFGLTFHPRMLSWFNATGDVSLPAESTWARLNELFEEEPDGYVHFRRSLLRDAAYEGLPYRLRRQLHGVVAARLESELEAPEESADVLALHYFEAGEYASAWRYARIAAKRAADVYAYVEAAGMYTRALQAGRKLSQLADKELAAVYESLGDSWTHAGDFRKASDAFTAARQLTSGDVVMKAALTLKRSRMEAKLGNHEDALRWAARAGSALNGLASREANRLHAQTTAWYATMLQVEGRTAEAVQRARRAVTEAEQADDPESLGAAYLVLGWASGDLGKDDSLAYLQRSLDAYQRAGNRVRQVALLSNLGVACGWEGRWDEAMSYYARARAESLKIGSRVDAELAQINIAEILIDRGDVDTAEKLLLETLPVLRALEYRYFLGACLVLFGRLAMRAGRFDEALARIEDARAHFIDIGAQGQVYEIDARVAECRLCMGDFDAAVELAQKLLGRAATAKGAAKAIPLLERVRGLALLRRGDRHGARQALEAALAAARTRRDLFEVMLALNASIELSRCEGVEPAAGLVAESEALAATLKIRGIPTPQACASAAT